MLKLKLNYVLAFLFFGFYCLGNDELKGIYRQSNDKFYAGDYVEAMRLKMQALSMAEKSKDCYWIAIGNTQVGGLNYYLKNKSAALQQFYTAKLYADSCNLDKIKYLIYQDIGVIYVEDGIVDSALKYMNLTAEKLKGTKKYSDLSRTYAILSVLYLGKMKDFKQAEAYINEAEKYALLSKKDGDMMFVEMKKASFYKTTNQYALSLKHFKKAYEFAIKSNVVEEKLSCLSSMSDLLAKMGDKEAAVYFSKYNILKDSVFNAETANKLAGYKVKYETEKKDMQNKLLQKDIALNQQEIKRRNNTIIALGLSLAVLVVLVLWRMNVLHLKRKQKELETAQQLQKEKQRISRDLHDNVGGQLSYVLYSLDDLTNSDENKRVELSKNINESVRTVIGNLRETIWAINDEELSVTDLADKLKVYARAMFKHTNTKITFNETIITNVKLNSVTGLNLYRICQEIINNCFKHANATELAIAISTSNSIAIQITDNGKGFDISHNQHNSYGLLNLKNRALESNIQLNLESQSNIGTVYTLVV